MVQLIKESIEDLGEALEILQLYLLLFSFLIISLDFLFLFHQGKRKDAIEEKSQYKLVKSVNHIKHKIAS